MHVSVFSSSLTLESIGRLKVPPNPIASIMAYASSANPQTVSAKKPKYDTTDMECYTETNGVITTTMFDVPGVSHTAVPLLSS